MNNPSRGRRVRADREIPENDAHDNPASHGQVSTSVSQADSSDTKADESAQSVVSQAAVSGDLQSPATSKGPARGYSWETFTAGNTAALKHGASSAQADVRALEIVAEMKATPGLEYLQANLFSARLDAYARAAARVELMDAWVGTLDAAQAGTASRTNSPLERLRQAAVRAGNLGEGLGLSPVVDDDLASEIAKAAAVVARRRERQSLHDALREAVREQQDSSGDHL